ncbi:MAG: S8 family serine peptidase [Candidatus Absconditicoccaceae bacterium]
MKNLKKFLNSVLVIFLISTQFNFLFAQENLPSKQIQLGSKIDVVDSQEKNYVQGEIIVKFKPTKINLKSSSSNNLLNTFEINNNLESASTIKTDNIAVMKIENNQNFDQKLVELNNDPSVEYAQPNYIYKTFATTFNDTYSGSLRALSNIHRYEAYEMFSGNVNTTGTIVAVIDAGVAYNHPDLAANMWNGTSCKDDAGIALNNCVHGYDFADIDNNPFPVRSDHGTHVAGTIAAAANNGSGIIGINPHAQIMAIRVGDDSMTTEAVVRGINFAKYNGAKIINASFGGSSSDTAMSDAINQFGLSGGLFIAAAGNGNNYGDSNGDNHDASQHVYPCDYTHDNIICVAATDDTDGIAFFSDYGTTSVDIGAPGVSIYSSLFLKNTLTGLRDDFESYAGGSAPAGWPIGGTQNNRGISDLGGSRGKVYYSDLAATYANNTDSYTETGKDLTIYSGATISFWTRCDTEYSGTAWTDYMSLLITTGSTYNPLDLAELGDNKWDEPMIDTDADPNNNTNSGVSMFLSADIPGSYLTNNFKVRFNRTTNASDNIYNGCLIDDITIQGYTPSSSIENYGNKNGTSMAAPHVAGLTSLAWSASPSLSYSQIKNIIINSGDTLPALVGKTVSGKRINAQNILWALGYSSNSGANYPQIYAAIGQILSGQSIQNNLNTVTNNNVNNFSGLYFARMSGSNELGRITFYTGLDLTDTGTQDFLSGDLPTSIGMSPGQIWFAPGTGFISKNAKLQMNLPYSFLSILGSINSGSFIVREGSGGAVTGNSMISSVYSGTCVGTGNYACPLYLAVSHFTQFDLKPVLTNVNIKSNNSINTNYAKSGHIVTLSWTGSKSLTSVSATINGLAGVVTGSTLGRYTTFTVTGGTAETGIIFSINYQDLSGNAGNVQTTTTDGSFVKIDNTSPSITVTSPSTVSTGLIVLQGTSSDTNGVSQIYVNGSLATGTGSWSKTAFTLTGGVNTINISGLDLAGNLTTITSNITRLPLVSSVTSQVLSGTAATISFNSDFVSSGYIIYGTSTLNNIFTGTLSTGHSMIVNGLVNNTTYYYRAYATVSGITGDMSSTGSFVLPYIIPITGTSNITTTGTIDLGGGTSTTFTNSGTLRLYGTGSTTNYFEIDLEGLGVLSDSGAWNGLIYGPIQTGFVGTVPSYTDYTHQSSLTFKMGADNVAITFNGQSAMVKVWVGSTYNDKLLRVYRSSNGTTYTRKDDCTVSAGYCTFVTDTFSYFTMMSPASSGGGGGGGGGGDTSVDLPSCKISDVICVDGEYELDGNVDCDGGYLGDACDEEDAVVEDTNTDEGDISDSPFDTQLNDAYLYAYQIGITTMPTVQKANMTGTLQRSHLAKMIVNYAAEVLDRQADTSKTCNFSDTSDQTTELKGYIKTACQMGLMGVGLKTFYPKNKVTRAEFGTILSRALRGNGNDQSGGNYYSKHLQALKYAGIMTQISVPGSIEIRGYVMLMLMRAKDKQ